MKIFRLKTATQKMGTMQWTLVISGYLFLWSVPNIYGETTEASVSNNGTVITITKADSVIADSQESPTVKVIHVNAVPKEIPSKGDMKTSAMSDFNQKFTSQNADIQLHDLVPNMDASGVADISPFFLLSDPPANAQLKLAPLDENVSNEEPASLTFNDIFQISPADKVLPKAPKFSVPPVPEVVIPTLKEITKPTYPPVTESTIVKSTRKSVHTITTTTPLPVDSPPTEPVPMTMGYRERVPLVSNPYENDLYVPPYTKRKMYTPYQYESYSKYKKHSYKPRKAIYLSSRPPMYPKEKSGMMKKWVDLAKYKHGYYESLHNERVLREASYYGPDTPMSLLEAGSTFNFKYQFKASENRALSTVTQTPRKRTADLDDMMSDLDQRVDPCEDFYQFACGGFLANRTRSNGVVNKLHEVKDRLKNTISLVLGKQRSASDPVALSKGKQFYQSCMNTRRLEQRGLDPLRNFLSDRGGWPVLGLWDPKRFNLEDILGRTRPLVKDYSTHSMPTGVIVGMTVQRDFVKPGTHTFYFDQPSLGQVSLDGMPNADLYKLRNDVIYNMAYEDYLVDIAVALGANPRVARRDMQDLVKFEMSMVKIMAPEVSRRKVATNYKTISILEMSLRYPYFDWFRFIKQVVTSTDAKISPKLSDKVVLWSQNYFDRLGKLLAKVPRRVLANYVLFRSIQPMVLATNKLMQYINLRYIAVLNGASHPKLDTRSDFCGSLVVQNMDWLASRIFVESSLDKGDVDLLHNMKGFVKDALRNHIENSAWLDEQTKKMQLLKIKLIEDRIAFPDKLLRDNILDEYYKDFSLTDDLFENMEEVMKRNYAKLLSKVHITPANDWITRPSDTHYLYNPGAHAIEIPSILIQYPFIQSQNPIGLSFGGIGTVVANSYTEAFDISGMKFDWSGALDKIWSKDSLRTYERKAKCLVKQYSSYFLPDANIFILNGGKTLNSNLRDNVALGVAYDAYKLWKSTKSYTDQPPLPYTEDQLYFINYARTMCQSATPTYTRKLPYTSLESVPRLRVIGPLQNSRDFANAFKCPVDSLMNPREKCTFW